MAKKEEVRKAHRLTRIMFDRMYHAIKVAVETGYEGYLDLLSVSAPDFGQFAWNAYRLAEDDELLSYADAIDLAFDH